jgi:hypothetical protein
MDEADGTSSYDIDLPEGGVAVLIGNSIQQGPESDNSTIVAYGAEGIKRPANELYVVNNTVVNDRAGGVFFSIAGGPTVSKFYGNLYVGQGTIYSGAIKDSAGNVTTQSPGFVDRANYDYHLTAGAPAIDKAKDPGTGAGMSLSPVSQYVHPRGRMDRAAVGSLDAGAFEYGLTADILRHKTKSSTRPEPVLRVGGPGFGIAGPEQGPVYDGVGARVRWETAGSPFTPSLR